MIGALQGVHVWTSGLDLEQVNKIPSDFERRFHAELMAIWFDLQIRCFSDNDGVQQFCSTLLTPVKIQCTMWILF